MEEIWKLLEEYPNYEVSTLGRVRRIYGDGSFEIVEPYYEFEQLKVDLDNYRGVDPQVLDGVVLWTFNPYKGRGGFSTIIHIDGDPMNCRLDNLRWKNDVIDEQERLKKRKVYCEETDLVYGSVAEAAGLLGIEYRNVLRCCNGETVQTNGYHFSYYDKPTEKIKSPRIRNRGEKVYCKNLIDGSVTIFANQKEAIEILGLPSIKQVLSGRQKKAGNYILSYDKNEIL